MVSTIKHMAAFEIWATAVISLTVNAMVTYFAHDYRTAVLRGYAVYMGFVIWCFLRFVYELKKDYNYSRSR